MFVFVDLRLAALVHARAPCAASLRAQPGVAVVLLAGSRLGCDRRAGQAGRVLQVSRPTSRDRVDVGLVWNGSVCARGRCRLGRRTGRVGRPSLLSLRSADPRQRVFAVLTVGVTVAVVAQAAYVDAFQHRVHERYTFYVVPLLVVGLYVGRRVCRGVALLFARGICARGAPRFWSPPATRCALRTADSRRPCSAWISLRAVGSTARLVWAVGLAVAAVVVWPISSRPHVWMVLAVLISGGICTAGTRALLDFIPERGSDAAAHDLSLFRLEAPSGAALVTWTEPTSSR